MEKDNKVSEITKEVQSSYDFLEQGYHMLSNSKLKDNNELDNKFYDLMTSIEELKDEVELLEEDE